jgi:hypothetical protein
MNILTAQAFIDGKLCEWDINPEVEDRFEKDMKTAISKLEKSGDVNRLVWMAAQHADSTVPAYDEWKKGVRTTSLRAEEIPLDSSASSSSGAALPSPSNLVTD